MYFIAFVMGFQNIEINFVKIVRHCFEIALLKIREQHYDTILSSIIKIS